MLSVERSALWVLMDHLAPVLAQEANVARPSRVLLLIDQFEEVFSGARDQREVDQFIGLVSEFFRKPHPQLYIVTTMRTDFIGQCANFPGLAEILNDTQYITPVLRGQDLRDAISCPVETYQGEIEPALVTELIRDMGSGAGYDADHLPLMQHALLWLWQRACADAGITEPSGPDPDWPADRPRVGLTLEDYRRHGRLAGILNRHADDILARIESGPEGEAAGRIIDVMFRRVTERDVSARYKRSPVLASDVCALARCRPRELDIAIEPFCGIGASFVERRPTDRPDDPLLDLSHESLIRQWRWLRGKADDEAGKLYVFRRFVNDAQIWDQHGRSRADLKRGGQLWLLRDWWSKHQPTDGWARRYAVVEGSADRLSDCFPVVEAYRVASLRAERRARLVRWTAPPLGALALAAIISLSFMRENDVRLRAQGDAIVKAALLMGNDELAHGHAARALGIAVTLLQNKAALPYIPRAERLAYEALEEMRELTVQELTLPNSPRWSVDFSPGGRQMVSASGKWMTIADTAGGKARRVELPFADAQWGVRLSPDGGRALIWGQDGAFVLPLVQGEAPSENAELHPLLTAALKIGFGFFSADGNRIATFARGDTKTVFLWDAATGERFGKDIHLDAPASFGFLPALNPGGTLLAEPTMQGVAVYDVATGAQRGDPISRPEGRGQDNQAAMQGSRPPLVAFHPAKPATLVFVSGSGTSSSITLWDLDTKKSVWTLRQALDPLEINQVGFSQNGEFIAEWGTFGARILTVEKGEPVAFFGEHENGVSVLRFDTDRKQVATIGRDADITLRTWSLDADLPVQKSIVARPPGEAESHRGGTAGGGGPHPRHRGDDAAARFWLASGTLKIVQAQPPDMVAPRAHRDASPEISDPASDPPALLVYRKGDESEPVAALHGPAGKTAWTSLRLDGGDTLVGSTNDGYQYTWHYFPDRDALLGFAEEKLQQLLKGPPARVGLTASEGCLLETVGGRCTSH